MKRIITCLLLLTSVLPVGFLSARRYAGGDISLLPEYENAGVTYKDHDGNVIPDLLPWLHDQGMNAMRVRLFVNPEKYRELHLNDPAGSETRYDPNACQDLEYILPLCRRIVDNGFSLMLDFHYSDTWADPAKQWTPIEWEGLSDEQLYQKIYDYTRQTLEALKAEGVTPAFIQPGNEISYGMLWGKPGDKESDLKKTFMGSDANWERLGRLLSQAIKACREVCPEARIVLHTERVAQPDVEKNFYEMMDRLGVDYDVIGLSYYPYFHGLLPVLEKSLDMLRATWPGKEVMVVETGYPYAWEVPGSNVPTQGTWPLNDTGQDTFARQLVNLLEKYDDVDGLFWWWMEYNAYDNRLSNWYNAPLFDSRTGCATSALKTICSYAESSSVEEIPSVVPEEDTVWYNLHGMPVRNTEVPGIYISRGRKIIVR